MKIARVVTIIVLSCALAGCNLFASDRYRHDDGMGDLYKVMQYQEQQRNKVTK